MAVETKEQALALVAAIFVRAERRMAAEGHVAPEPAKESVLPGAGAVAA